MIVFTPPIQAVWDIFQSIVRDMLAVELEKVVYGQNIVFGKDGWRHFSQMDADGIFQVTASEFGIQMAVFDANPIQDVDGSFEALCFALRLTEEAPPWLKDSHAGLFRLKEPWIPAEPSVA